ncbi:MAG: hypothetical protein IKH75_17435 [Ruminococcus sp.]|nr:hypothetical protein [Ruminococcus sp.]
MRKITSAIAAILTIIAVLPFCTIRTYAVENYATGWDGNSEKSMIYDDCGLFTDSELDELDEQVRSCSEDLEMNICIFLAGSSYLGYGEYKTEHFANSKYDEIYGDDTDGIFYFLDFSGDSPAYDYISAAGKAGYIYGDHIDTINRSQNNYLPASGKESYADDKDDIAAAIINYLNQLRRYGANPDHSPFKYFYDEDTGKYFYYSHGKYIVSKRKPFVLTLKYLPFSASAGFIVSLVIFLVTKYKYRFKKSVNAGRYISKKDTEFVTKEDRYLRSYTTSRTISRESSGGGGGGFSGGGGGGGHIGGGSYR